LLFLRPLSHSWIAYPEAPRSHKQGRERIDRMMAT